MAVAVSIEPAALAAAPGEAAQATVSVRNDTGIVEEYRLHALGPGGEYVTLAPDLVSVYPGRTETVVVTVLVPRSSAVPAGELDVAIQVTPVIAPAGTEDADVPRTTEPEVVEFVIRVEEFAAVGAEIVPKVSRSRGRKRVRLAVDNNGNTPTAAALVGAGTERLRVIPRDPEVLIDAGHAQFVRVTLSPRRRVWRGQAVSHPYSVTVTPASGDPLVVDGIHMQDPVFPSWFWKALLALAALIALLILLWNLLLKPTVEQTARDAVKEPLAEVQGQAQDAQKTADGAQQTADEAKAAAGSGGGTSTPPPAPPQPTSEDQTYTLTVTAGKGKNATSSVPAIPDGSALQITDLVFNNPQGDVATLQLAYGQKVLLSLSTENYRDLDLHFVTPIQVPSGQTLQARLNCIAPGQPTGRTPDNCVSSVLITGTLVTPPPAG
ncbi:hypothetical protein ACH3VR_05025 [Microbacterium sp. B2969]|uniref:Hydrolytic protein n=1 Tax=Microbacterium alkaliflavum TaxID=3248839 RepID=A0ABW7Q4E3_9MICO